MAFERVAESFEIWRLIDTGVADGAMNMAIDEALLLSHEQGKTPPTLRFYAWRPSCVSIGLFQCLEREIDVAECKARGIDIVRRPTGGRAVLHSSELTYSLVLKSDHPFVRGNIRESYRRISEAIASGLRALGADVWLTSRLPRAQRAGSRTCIKTPACFDTPSNYELTSNGRKLVGSAQLRRRGVVLQHGSIIIDADVNTLVSVLRIKGGSSQERLARDLCTGMIGLKEALGRDVDYREIVRCLVCGFQENASVILVPGELTKDELRLVRQLRDEKYCSKEWNYRR